MFSDRLSGVLIIADRRWTSIREAFMLADKSADADGNVTVLRPGFDPSALSPFP
jgi:hypothetical protein